VEVTEWLLDSDPSIRWQTLRDLTDASAEEIAAERARVVTEGWGAALLGRQAADGTWGGEDGNHSWDAGGLEWNSLLTLLWLRDLGVDPADERVRAVTTRTADNVKWVWWDNRPFFQGEVEPCINGRILALAAYFGHDSGDLVPRLLGEQMADRGWNCEQENGSKRGSFHSTINVLEGLLAHEQAYGASDDVSNARRRGEDYLLERRLLRRLSTGEIVDPEFTELAFPPGYHYDLLRALDYFRAAERRDDRLAEALELVEGKCRSDGRWAIDAERPEQLEFEARERAGEPSRWVTLRALRVLRWASQA
jgi:hypothetical protein